ncbi:MAG: HAMP domain-containing protein [Desulfobacterales bacterium]|nr:HAMP domain-containing protein [Desulfobacterales bacterium]
MKQNKYKQPTAAMDRKRRKRDIIIIVGVFALISVLSYITVQSFGSGSQIPPSNMVLMFILMNINMLLLILLFFLIFRNVIKLYYERRRRVAGSRLRTKLVAAFMGLTLLPTIVLFFFSIQFITTSIEFWFKIPIEQALENSLEVGQNLYKLVEENNTFFLDKAAYQISSRDLLDPKNRSELANYAQVVQRAFNLNAVEIYNANFNRLTQSVSDRLKNQTVHPVDADALQKGMDNPEKTWSVSENTAAGEIIRNMAAIPYGAEGPDIEGFVVVSILLPPDLQDNLVSISKGVEEYQQMKMLKRPIRLSYYITLTVVSLLVVFCAIWVGMYLSRNITVPIIELSEGTRRVAEGDLSYRIDVVADDEIKTLVDSFNKMTRDLRFNRKEIEFSAKKLYEQNVEIEERRRYMEIVLNNVSTGVISFDSHGLITTINDSAEQMLNINADRLLNKSYKQLLNNEDNALIHEIRDRFWTKREESLIKSVNMAIAGKMRSFKVTFNALKDDNGRHIGLVMVFDDMTEIEKAQRMAAWREVARRIAHEVKNPLTPISLSAQRLKRKYKAAIDDPVFDECIQTIAEHTELIRNLVNEFSTFAKFPTANPAPCELIPIVEESIALYQDGYPNIEFNVQAQGSIPVLQLDRQQVKQTLINLIDNAISSIKTEGSITVEVSYDDEQDRVYLIVADTGEGVDNHDKPYLFEPDFTTKKSGMGLGLAIVSTIVSDHNGRIWAEDNQPKGTRFIIELPVNNA